MDWFSVHLITNRWINRFFFFNFNYWILIVTVMVVLWALSEAFLSFLFFIHFSIVMLIISIHQLPPQSGNLFLFIHVLINTREKNAENQWKEKPHTHTSAVRKSDRYIIYRNGRKNFYQHQSTRTSVIPKSSGFFGLHRRMVLEIF